MPLYPSSKIRVEDDGTLKGYIGELDFTTGLQVTVSGDTATVTATGAGIDHGSLSGLADDDHTQYLLLAGRGSVTELFGTSAENGELHIYGTSFGDNSSGTIWLNELGGNVDVGGTLICESGVEVDQISDAGAGHLEIQPDGGNTVIGATSTPTARLSLGATAQINLFHLYQSGDVEYGSGIASNEARHYVSGDSSLNRHAWGKLSSDGNRTWTEWMRLQNGRVGLGGGAPATSALLDLSSTTGALLLPRMTSTQRDALTAVAGMLIYNTTTSKFQGYNGAWVDLH